MSFRNPELLWLLILIPLLLWLRQRRQIRSPRLVFSSLTRFAARCPSLRLLLKPLMVGVQGLSMGLLVLAFARPQQMIEHTNVLTEGIDIVLAIDVSGSMQALDFVLDGKRANRLQVVKQVVRDFVAGRESDQMGMVVFASRPYTACPLTLDYDLLLSRLDEAQIGLVEDGTAIGSAIATSVKRLEARPTKSKVIILLTDGINNTGKIDPMTAAELAKTMGVKIYTIGAGTNSDTVLFPDRFGNLRPVPNMAIDDASLKRIAETTGGVYFRATDTESLKQIYATIDQLEKTKSKVDRYREYKELFPYFLLPGICLFVIEVLLSNTVFRVVP